MKKEKRPPLQEYMPEVDEFLEYVSNNELGDLHILNELKMESVIDTICSY